MSGLGNGINQAVPIDVRYPDAGPVKPSDLSRDVSVMWDHLLTQIDSRVLLAEDVHQLRNLAELIVQAKALSKEAMANPYELRLTRTWLSVVDQVRKLSALFGLSPGGRSRLKLGTSEFEDDPFQEWIR